MTDIASLSIEVRGDGVDQTTQSLDRLGHTAERTSTSVQRAETKMAQATLARARADAALAAAASGKESDDYKRARSAVEVARTALLVVQATEAETRALQAQAAANDSVAAANADLASRKSMLRAKFDETYASAVKLESELADLAEAERLGVTVTGGFSAALDNLIQKHDAAARAAARQAQEYRDLSAAEAAAATQMDRQNQLNAQFGFNQPSRRVQEWSGPLADMFNEQDAARIAAIQAQFNQFAGIQDKITYSAREAAVALEAQAREFEQDAAAAARLRSLIDPLGTAQARYNAEIAEYNALAARGVISARELGQAHALAATRLNSYNQMMSGMEATARGRQANLANIVAQFQDVGITAAMGMNPLTIALQQGTQLSQALVMMEKPLEGIAKGILALISPLSLATIGLIGLTAVGLQMVDWASVASAALNGLAWVIENLTPYILGLSAMMALIYAPAILSGIATARVAVATLGATAFRAAAAFTIAWLAALGPGGWFVLGLAAVITAAMVFRDELSRIFGVDIVGAARDGINAVIGVIVGGYEAAKVVWNDFPSFMGEVGQMVAWKMGAAFRSMLRDMAIQLNVFMKSVGDALGFENAPWIDANKMVPEYRKEGGKLVPNYPMPTLSSGGQKTIDAATAAFNSAQGTNYLGNIGGAISSGASAAADKLRELAGGFGSVEEAAGKAGGAGKSAMDNTKAATEAAAKAAEQLAGKMLDAAKGLGQSFGGIFKGLLDKTMTWKDAAIQALGSVLQYLNKINLAQGGGGIFGGGLLQGLIGGFLGIGFASGGYTGDGATDRVAGVVHGKEYVFSAAATARIGRQNLEALHKGFRSGGYVAPVPPRMQVPANDRPQRLHVTLGVAADGNGNLMPFVQSVAEGEAARASQRVAKAVPAMVDQRNDQRQYRKIRPSS